MKFQITKWTIKKLISSYKSGKLSLNPPYQRNFIWSIRDQQELINSIDNKVPIPTFFLLKKGMNYEMVDGQQRSRTILSYVNKDFKNASGRYFSEVKDKSFLSFEFPVTIITNTEKSPIEKFYALVNKTGIHVNKPEIRKAEFYNTNLLQLVNDIAESRKIKSLNLFSETSLKRMNDSEFISELIVLVKAGHVDKKGLLEEYFEEDLLPNECQEIKSTIDQVLSKIVSLNQLFRITDTRYKQRNDFYTLFDFINTHDVITVSELKYFYKLLVIISADIKPSQEDCKPLMEYAFHCVTQSNSKNAREKRLQFFEELLLNKNLKGNKILTEICKFYGVGKNRGLKRIGNYITLDIQQIVEKNEEKNNIQFLE